MTVTWKGMRDLRRVVLLLALSVVGMAILGSAAMATQYAKDGRLKILWEHPGGALEGLGVGFVVGAVVGLVTAPAVVPALFQKRLLVAVPAVYGTSLAVVVLFTLVTDFGIWEALPTAGIAFVSVCAGSFGAQALLPDARSEEKRCPSCGYDLRGADHKVCPECGVPSG